jgi:hypothetical protein|tara:strand:+ start:2186 stop:2317 length:132 start_codon:yes stop_codon:yes gene_type:complete
MEAEGTWDQFRMILKKIKKSSKRQAASNKRQAATLYTLTPGSG